MKKIVIIGGGASGLMAAIAAKHEDTQVVILEREKRVGKKILATGNGRCNMTNMYAALENYHGTEPEFVKGAIKRFWVTQTLEFFSELGILWKEEKNGKVYPYSDTASSVLDVLRRKVENENIEVICEFDVKEAIKSKSGFQITSYDGRRIFADSLIIAAGGKATPSLGSNGSGFDLLRAFGHKVTKLSPSLVQIKTETEVVRKIKGLKINGRMSLGDKTESGEILFTEYGLSGPPVFSLSAYLNNQKYACIDLMPEYSFDEIKSLLYQRCAYLYDVTLEEFFTGMLNKRIGQALLKSVNISPLSRLCSTLSEKEINNIVSAIKCWKFTLCGTMSWNNAQVTRGGVYTSEFNPSTMESRIVPQLYACGEVLDIDGDCGGYNLQWAWSSGYIAGNSSAKIRNKETNK